MEPWIRSTSFCETQTELWKREYHTEKASLNGCFFVWSHWNNLAFCNSTEMHLAKSRQTRTQLGPATIKGTLRRNSAMDGRFREYAFNSNPQMSSCQRRWNSRVAHLHRRFTFSSISSGVPENNLRWRLNSYPLRHQQVQGGTNQTDEHSQIGARSSYTGSRTSRLLWDRDDNRCEEQKLLDRQHSSTQLDQIKGSTEDEHRKWAQQNCWELKQRRLATRTRENEPGWSWYQRSSSMRSSKILDNSTFFPDQTWERVDILRWQSSSNIRHSSWCQDQWKTVGRSKQIFKLA